MQSDYPIISEDTDNNKEDKLGPIELKTGAF